MNKYLVGAVIVLLVGLGVGYLLPHSAPLGGGDTNYFPEFFVNGLKWGANGATQLGQIKSTGDMSLLVKGTTAVPLTLNGVSGTTADFLDVTASGGTTGALYKISSAGKATASLFGTQSICNSTSTTGILSCGASPAGFFDIPAGYTTTTVTSTAVTANSTITFGLDQSHAVPLGVTCNSSQTTSTIPYVTTSTPGSSFVVNIPSAPVTNPMCYSYNIIN